MYRRVLGFAALGLVEIHLRIVSRLNIPALVLTAIARRAVLLLRNKRSAADLSNDFNRALQAIGRAPTNPDRGRLSTSFLCGRCLVMCWFFPRHAGEADGISKGVLNNFGDLRFISVPLPVRLRWKTFAGEIQVRRRTLHISFINDLSQPCFCGAGASLRNSILIENYIIGERWWASCNGLDSNCYVIASRDSDSCTNISTAGFGWAMLFAKPSGPKAASSGFKKIDTLTQFFRVSRGMALGQCGDFASGDATRLFARHPLAAIVFGQWWVAQRGR